MPPKRKVPTLEELLERPWCYYCDRDFDDEKNLVDHQKAKHFMCTVPSCRRRLNTVGGLAVHLQQVHKEELHDVPNALPSRNNTKLEIFANVGIPEEVVKARTDQVLKDYHQIETDYFKKTGNPLPGSGREHISKKPKMEDKESLKARVLEAKAKAAARKAARAAGLPDPTEETSSPTPPVAPVTPATPAVQAAQAAQAAPTPTYSTPTYPAFPAQPTPPAGVAQSPPPGMYFPTPSPVPTSLPMPVATGGFTMPHVEPYGFPQGMPVAPGYHNVAHHNNFPVQHGFQAPNRGWKPPPSYGAHNITAPYTAPPPPSNPAVDQLINGVFDSNGRVPAEYQASGADKPIKQEPADKPIKEEPVDKPIKQEPADESPQKTSSNGLPPKPIKQEPVDHAPFRLQPISRVPEARLEPRIKQEQQTPEPSCVVPPVPVKQEHKTPEPVSVTPSTRTGKGEQQLLTDNYVSWEEKRAQSARYTVKAKISQIPTQTAAQGVSGAVDDALGN